MFVKVFPPFPELARVVKRVVVLEYTFGRQDALPVNPFPPRPEHCLYFYPRDRVVAYNYADGKTREAPAVMLVGPQTKRVDLQMGRDMSVVIVAFYPGALHRLIGVPMHEMLNQSFDASLFLKNTTLITEQLNECKDSHAMNVVVQSYLREMTGRFKALLPVEKVINDIMEVGAPVRVEKIADIACVSRRQLERQVMDRVGMSPKMLLRLMRFSNAWLLREQDANRSWLSIAHTTGYADQMHMIRDFKEFAGVNPGSILRDLEQSPLRLQADGFSE